MTAPLLDPALLPLLRCPETRQALTLLRPEETGPLETAIAAGDVVNRGGKTLKRTPEAFLLREDRAVVYPVCGGIPLLLVEEGISVPG